MTDAIVNEVLRLIQQLDREERLKLMAFLQATLADFPDANNPEIPNSLFGKHANPQSTVSAADLDAYLHEIATEWEEDFVDWPMLDVEVLSDDLKLRREDLYDDPFI